MDLDNNFLNNVYLALGSNLGEKILNLERAVIEIEHSLGKIKKKSKWYFSKAEGFETKNDFVNGVIYITSRYSALEILNQVQLIEQKMGRIKSSDKIYEDRIIDIDIIYFNEEIIATDELNIPHLEIFKRKFVYEPLLEIAPDKWDPNFDQNIREIVDYLEKNA